MSTPEPKVSIWTRSSEDGRYYYTNILSKKSQWHPPNEFRQDQEPDLPHGWTSTQTPQGRLYINNIGQYTTWFHPYGIAI